MMLGGRIGNIGKIIGNIKDIFDSNENKGTPQIKKKAIRNAYGGNLLQSGICYSGQQDNFSQRKIKFKHDNLNPIKNGKIAKINNENLPKGILVHPNKQNNSSQNNLTTNKVGVKFEISNLNRRNNSKEMIIKPFEEENFLSLQGLSEKFVNEHITQGEAGAPKEHKEKDFELDQATKALAYQQILGNWKKEYKYVVLDKSHVKAHLNHLALTDKQAVQKLTQQRETEDFIKQILTHTAGFTD